MSHLTHQRPIAKTFGLTDHRSCLTSVDPVSKSPCLANRAGIAFVLVVVVESDKEVLDIRPPCFLVIRRDRKYSCHNLLQRRGFLHRTL